MTNTTYLINVTNWEADTIYQSIDTLIHAINFVADKESMDYKSAIKNAQAIKETIKWREDSSVESKEVAFTLVQLYLIDDAYQDFTFIVDNYYPDDRWDEFFSMNGDIERKVHRAINELRKEEMENESNG